MVGIISISPTFQTIICQVQTQKYTGLPSCKYVKYKARHIYMNLKLFKLAAQAHGFYDWPIWEIGKPKPLYFPLFTWTYNDSQPPCLQGTLREELFDTLEKKILYLQGVFEDLSEGYGILRSEHWIQFANSHKKVERCKNWLNEIAYAKGLNRWGGGVLEHNIKYIIPICHKITIAPELVKYIQEYVVN